MEIQTLWSLTLNWLASVGGRKRAHVKVTAWIMCKSNCNYITMCSLVIAWGTTGAKTLPSAVLWWLSYHVSKLPFSYLIHKGWQSYSPFWFFLQAIILCPLLSKNHTPGNSLLQLNRNCLNDCEAKWSGSSFVAHTAQPSWRWGYLGYCLKKWKCIEIWEILTHLQLCRYRDQHSWVKLEGWELFCRFCYFVLALPL